MLTSEQLQAIMPALPPARRDALFPFLTAALEEFDIASPARAAAFLAQLAHESAQLRFMEELWGPTAAQQRYEPQSTLAARLGNTEPGDGGRFKGRGPIQITGRANYGRFGDLLGIDLLADRARAARPEVAFRIAGLFWSKKGLNVLADERTDDAFREITRRINGGFNGLDDRRRFYDVARAVLAVPDAPVTRGGPRPVRPRAPEPDFGRGWEAIVNDAGPEKPTPTARGRRTSRKRTRKAPASKPTKPSRRTRAAPARNRTPQASTRTAASPRRKTPSRKTASRSTQVGTHRSTKKNRKP